MITREALEPGLEFVAKAIGPRCPNCGVGYHVFGAVDVMDEPRCPNCYAEPCNSCLAWVIGGQARCLDPECIEDFATPEHDESV